jgi:hypothetical protein
VILSSMSVATTAEEKQRLLGKQKNVLDKIQLWSSSKGHDDPRCKACTVNGRLATKNRRGIGFN